MGLLGGGLKCPKCRGHNISVQMVDIGSKTSKTTLGVGGKAHNAARTVAAISTMGLSNLVITKAHGREVTKNKMKKIAICQDCGKSWTV